jgi:hypothetical protein
MKFGVNVMQLAAAVGNNNVKISGTCEVEGRASAMKSAPNQTGTA